MVLFNVSQQLLRLPNSRQEFAFKMVTNFKNE